MINGANFFDQPIKPEKLLQAKEMTIQLVVC